MGTFQKTQKPSNATTFWLVGGCLGVVIGLAIGLTLISNLTGLESPTVSPVYEASFTVVLVNIAIALIIILLFFGSALGVVIGKIFIFVDEIYSKRKGREF